MSNISIDSYSMVDLGGRVAKTFVSRKHKVLRSTAVLLLAPEGATEIELYFEL